MTLVGVQEPNRLALAPFHPKLPHNGAILGAGAFHQRDRGVKEVELRSVPAPALCSPRDTVSRTLVVVRASPQIASASVLESSHDDRSSHEEKNQLTKVIVAHRYGSRSTPIRGLDRHRLDITKEVA